ncbi:MAG: hypothetical protein RLZZ381_1923, partial [Cyanobacteriota bacterium]|jgi:hypothetical protein
MGLPDGVRNGVKNLVRSPLRLKFGSADAQRKICVST